MAYSTMDSPVFIGPFTTPEKRWALAVPASLRRSPRLSSPIHDVDEGPSLSRSATPDNDAWQDEPSSALASRITRAHDNPSPPPAQEPDSGPPTPQRDPIPFPFSTHPSRNVDLISFDSSTELFPTPIAPPSFIPPASHAPSVDELLSSWSPSAQQRAAEPVASPHESGSGTQSSFQSTPDAEEQAIADALTVPDEADVQMSDGGLPHTPLRRSTRPRRSGTPHAHLVPLPLSDDESSPGKASPRTRRKGKEKDVPVANENSSGPSFSNVVLLDDDSQKRQKMARKSSSANGVFGHRQLGSLSPASANVLSQLLPASTPTPFPESDETQRPYSFSVFSPDPAPPLSPPIRASPARNARPKSPTRIQFQTQSSEDLSQSPARRIPVEEAVARGQISPQRGAALLSGAADPGPSSKTPVFHIPPQDTPARRVQLAPPTPGQGKWQGIRFGSPTRSKSPELNEPRPPWNASTAGGAGPSGSKSRSSPRTVVSPLKKGKLPFPLIPSVSDQPVPSSTSSTSDATSSERTTPSIIKISRSNLKQPTSRIPRIGQKPYSRPSANVGTTKPSRLPLKSAETVKAAPQVTQGMRVAGGASSDSVEAGPSNLKRKRPPSPQSKPRPVALRQVPLPKGPPKITPAPARAASPAKRGPVTKFRMVDLHSRPEGIEPSQDGLELDGNPISSPIKRAPVGRFRMVDLHARPVDSFHRDKSPELVTELTPELQPPRLETLQAASPPAEAVPLPPPSRSPSPPSPPNEPEIPKVVEESLRRTTRVRKSALPTTGLSQPLSSRRKAAPNFLSSATGPFAGMTAVALKALTSSNTTKNQRYLAAKLETQVIKKEGDRPESPGMKVRTVSQREADERGAKRKERAARRARRGEDVTEEEAMGMGHDEMDVDSDLDSSPLPRHRRGPGDEEDYETPRPNGKRARTASLSGEEEEKKRVKWDRGLSTTVFLDEVELRPWARPKESGVLKGCLTPAAKALRLDPLGNHPQAESPLRELIEENVLIKKFVYDNDELEPPPVAPIKTRSKSKKK